MNTRMQPLTQVAPTPSLTPVPRGFLQRKCACGGSPGLTGECAECATEKGALQRSASNQSAPGAGFSLSRISVMQPKRTGSPTNDPLEQEADRIADQVMAAPAHSAVSGAPPRIQRYTVQATWQVGGTHARRRGPAGLLWHRATSVKVIHAL